MNRVRYILLCEDEAHARFMREVLKITKGDYRQQRVITVPKGKGSGEQFVREEFPTEIRAFRARNYQPNLGLIVIIDADRHEVQHRIQQLNRALSDQEMPSVATEEPVLMAIPKWCLETWVAHIIYGSADESERCQTYKNQIQSTDYRKAAQLFSENIRSPPDDWLPSMQRCAEQFTGWLEKLG